MIDVDLVEFLAVSNKVARKSERSCDIEPLRQLHGKKVNLLPLLDSLGVDFLDLPNSTLFKPKNSYDRAKGLVDTVSSGLYPPSETMEWLGNAFKKFIESGGKRDLRDLLGLNPGPGGASNFDTSFGDQMKAMAIDVHILNRHGLSIEKACGAVSEKAAAGEYIDFFGRPHSCGKKKQWKAPGIRAIRGYCEKMQVGEDAHVLFMIHYPTKKLTVMRLTKFHGQEYLKKLEQLRAAISPNSEVIEDSSELAIRKVLETLPEATRSWVESEIKY
ncbi:MAG: hypothetical protein JXR59_03990 [Desulfuromonadaceae bacterium]|nr:hypothetical protein [Desulfuromonadaceae bacterium]